jgi:hypothetical protein
MNIQKRILIGITGGIGAYKSAELVRLLREADFKVLPEEVSDYSALKLDFFIE